MQSMDLIFRIADRANLDAAWDRVQANRGGPGIDSVTIADFGTQTDAALDDIATDLLAGTYSPDCISTFSILKPSGKTRVIGLLTVRDRVCAFAIVRVLRSLIEPRLQPCSFAYRPGRSASGAADYVEKLIRRGYDWILETDIESYFDTIDHGILLRFLRDTIDDAVVIDLIARFLRAPVAGVQSRAPGGVGITQGSPLSPLLSNLYLNDLDRAMVAGSFRYIRYADDLVVLAGSQDELHRAMTVLQTEIAALNLRLSEQKTRVGPVRDGFVFLGFQFNALGKGPAMKSIASIREKLNETVANTRERSLRDQIAAIGDVIRGWRQYFPVTADVFRDMPPIVLAAAIMEGPAMPPPDVLHDLTIRLWTADWNCAALHDMTAEWLY
ncbi:hypothetical protein JXA80_08855, partial [bacterium]|nr:hypothetical protein [candidate division CSSED10-310 bacterium]